MQLLKTLFFCGLIFAATQIRAEKKGMTVIIDPGHGGQDAGAAYRGIKEKDIVLGIGLKLGKYINEHHPDVKVVYTRNKDVFVPLHQRSEIANKNKADLFISLHANACGTPSIRGTETFILGLHRSQENLEVAKKENSVILYEEDHSERYEGFDPNSAESYIMFELTQDEFLDQSASFAKLVQDQFRHKAARNDRGVKQAGFLVLRQSGMPSVLVESGFLSNPSEAEYLNSEQGQAQLATAILSAFNSYKKNFDAKTGFNLETSNVPQKEQQTVQTEKKQADTTLTEKKAEPEKIIQPAKSDSAPTKNKPAIAVAKEEKPDIQETQVNKQHPSIIFSIQIAAGTTNLPLQPANFKGLNDVRKVQFGKMYKYYYGELKTLIEAESLQEKIKSKFPGCFIVAFNQGQIITKEDAIRLLEKH